jgi:hypothetical protein
MRVMTAYAPGQTSYSADVSMHPPKRKAMYQIARLHDSGSRVLRRTYAAPLEPSLVNIEQLYHPNTDAHKVNGARLREPDREHLELVAQLRVG